MCGIIGYTGGKHKPTRVVIDGLRRLEYRGYDSAGASWSTRYGFAFAKEVGKVANLAEKLEKAHSETQFAAIGHTRWATHGAVTVDNAHPHTSNKVAIVHNGIISNAKPLKEKLVHVGYHFVSETDSEVIAHLVDYYLDELRTPLEAVQAAIQDLDGTYGLACIFAMHPGAIVVARNGSPLVIGVGGYGHFVASDANALAQWTDRIIYLEDGDTALIDGCDIIMPQNRPTKVVELEDAIASKGDFAHFMLKEIYEQPDSIKRCFGGRIGEDTCRLGGFNLSQKELSEATSVTLIGCGTSWHAGLAARNVIEKMAGIPCSVELASEFSSRDWVADPTGLYLLISQSGETYDTLECAKELLQRGCKIFGVVNVVGSAIARIAGRGTYTHSGPELAVASTKAFTGQLAALMMFASMLGRAKGFGRFNGWLFNHELRQVPEKLENYIKDVNGHSRLMDAVRLIDKSPYVLFLGRGVHYPVAMEGALKLKEITYIPCDAYAGGEMKHGPIAMIDKGTPVIAINPKGPNNERMLSNIQEVAARGALIISICDTNDLATKELSWASIELPEGLSEDLSHFFSIVPLQLIAYWVAVQLGRDVDRPKNLAKSVTVG